MALLGLSFRCWNFRATENRTKKPVPVGARYKHARIQIQRDRNLIYPRNCYVILSLRSRNNQSVWYTVLTAFHSPFPSPSRRACHVHMETYNVSNFCSSTYCARTSFASSRHCRQHVELCIAMIIAPFPFSPPTLPRPSTPPNRTGSPLRAGSAPSCCGPFPCMWRTDRTRRITRAASLTLCSRTFGP